MATAAKQSNSSSVRGSSPASSVARASSPSTSLKKTVSSSSSTSLIEVRSSSVGSVGSGSGGAGEEDIETIAKQISDHAEAIYQTWKARGLAPTEILNCHSVNSDAFGKTLTPQRNNAHRESPVNEILNQSPTMSNNNLKKLVSSFVNEDKARQQQTVARKTNILTSGTIRDALRKFECVDGQPPANVKPNYVRYGNSNSNSGGIATDKQSSAVVQQHQQQRQTSPQPQLAQTAATIAATAAAPATSQLMQQSTYALSRSQSPQKQFNSNNYGNQLNRNVPDVLINTIDQSKLSSSTSTVAAHEKSPSPVRIKPETPAKPASLLNHTPAWPLKNRSVVENGSGSVSAAGIGVGKSTVIQTNKTATAAATTAGSVAVHNASNSITNNSHEIVRTTTTTGVKKSPNNKAKTSNLLDEVLLEEERLINALKTGIVLNNSAKTSLPEVITSTLTATTTTTPAATKVVAVPWSASDRDDTLVRPSTISSNPISNTNKTLNNNNLNSNKLNSQMNTSELDGGGCGQVKFTAKSRHKNDAAVPHPEVSNSSKTNGIMNPRATTSVPAVRPFLTRGSVAERVLMFEKCPEAKALRNVPKEPNKLSVSVSLCVCAPQKRSFAPWLLLSRSCDLCIFIH